MSFNVFMSNKFVQSSSRKSQERVAWPKNFNHIALGWKTILANIGSFDRKLKFASLYIDNELVFLLVFKKVRFVAFCVKHTISSHS